MDCDGPRQAMITDEDCTLTDPPLIGSEAQWARPSKGPCFIRAPGEDVNMRRAPRVGVWGFGVGNEMVDPTMFGLMRFDGKWPKSAWTCIGGGGGAIEKWPCWGVECCDKISPQPPPPPLPPLPSTCSFENTSKVCCALRASRRSSSSSLNSATCHQPMQTLDFSGEFGYEITQFQDDPSACANSVDDCKEMFYATWGFDVSIHLPITSFRVASTCVSC